MEAAAAEPEAVHAPVPILTEEEKADAWKRFESIIYANLDRILERRPAFPVSKFAKAILEDVDLDENGDRILKKKKKKDKKKKDEKKKDEKKKEKKGGDKKKKDKGSDNEEAKADGGDRPKSKKKDKKPKKDAAAAEAE